jgi:hypothetical protein
LPHINSKYRKQSLEIDLKKQLARQEFHQHTVKKDETKKVSEREYEINFKQISPRQKNIKFSPERKRHSELRRTRDFKDQKITIQP